MVMPLQKPEDELSNEPVDLGVSPNALRIARMIDRLEDGDYVIDLTKEVFGWEVEIASLTTLRMVNLKKKE